MRKISWIIPVMLVVFVILVACAAPAAKPPAAAKILKIGSITPLSGPAAEWGLEGEPLSDVYGEIIRQEGGIKVGDDIYQVQFVRADGPIYPPAADVAAARKLVYDEKVDCIAVYYGIANAPIAAITNPARVIFNQTSLAGQYYDPKQHPYCFFGFPNLQMAGVHPLAVAMALKAKVIAWAGVKTGNQQLEAVAAAADRIYMQQYGIKVVRAEWAPGDMDFTSYLQRMKEQGVEMITTMENLNTVGLLRKQGIQMGFKVPIVMSSSILEMDYMKTIVGGNVADLDGICGDYSGATWDLKQTKISPYYLAFAEKVKKKWKENTGKELENVGIIGTGCQMIGQYIEAVKQAGSKDPDAVMKVIRGGTLDTFLGTYTASGHTWGDFGPEGDVTFGNPCAISIIKDGKVQYLTEYPMRNVDTDVPIRVTKEMIQGGAKPPATAPAAPTVKTSFTASSWSDDVMGMSLAYPKKWVIEMSKPPAGFTARDPSPYQVPVLTLSGYHKETAQQEMEAQWKDSQMSNIKYVVQDQEFKLADGKTVKYSVFTSDYPGAKLRTYGINFEKNVAKADWVFSVGITTVDGMEDEALFKEILGTVSSK